MTQFLSTASKLLPQPPKDAEARIRYIDGHNCRQHFSCGGFFSGWTKGTTGMTQGDLLKASAITIDVDAYDWDGSAPAWGATRDERKAAMRAASEDEVIAWMKATDFKSMVLGECVKVGLPAEPNAVIYTGHGLCLVYWLNDTLGWTDEKQGAWTAARIKAVIKRFHGHNPDLWWWDSSAKDVGTRLFPIPGGKHRDTGKNVRLVGFSDSMPDLTAWLEGIEKKYPGNAAPAKKAKGKATGSKSQGVKSAGFGSGDWKVAIYNPAKHPHLEVGEKADECPECQGSGFKRLDTEHYTCFSCRTQFKVAPKFAFDAASFNKAPTAPGFLKLDANGYAQFPAVTPRRLVVKARTGSGKTHLMAREKKAWAPPSAWSRRVIAVAPTIALAKNLSERLGVEHGEAGSDVSLNNASLACCFASLVTKTYGVNAKVLADTYLMIDEAETVLSQLVGLFADGEKARETYNVLVHVAARCGKVMLCDANSGPVVERFIKDVSLATEAAEGYVNDAWELWHTALHKHDFAYIQPLVKLDKNGKETVISSSHRQHLGLVMKRIGEGKKLAIYVPGREAARALAETITKSHPKLNVQVRVRNESNDQQHDLTQAGLTADVLIYNNSMSTGVSYDVKGHYDEIHVMLNTGAVSDGIHIEQAVHRVRHPKSKTYFISGRLSAPVTDWRIDVKGQIERAANRMLAGEKVATSMANGVGYLGDWQWEDSSKRLARLQATIIASRYRHGFRWALTYIQAVHNVTPANGERDDATAKEVSDTREAIDRQDAQLIAEAMPLGDADFDRVEKNGAETIEEAHAFRAAKLGRIYGDGYFNADVAERAEVAYGTKRKNLARQTRILALSRLMGSDEDRVKAVEAEARSNSRKTLMTAEYLLPRAAVLHTVFASLHFASFEDGRWEMTREAAKAIVEKAMPAMKKAGMEVRADFTVSPFRQLQDLLSLGGLSMRSTRTGPKGARTRNYFLAAPDVERMVNLSEAFVTRWREHGVENDDTIDIMSA